jgi:hypothetical protein
MFGFDGEASPQVHGAAFDCRQAATVDKVAAILAQARGMR